ncbi:mannose-1-phosphate guanylyltransferase/mannose-6-phosphate isomerase [Neogemmobacter tilapiae]|uniref:mannose-1-phosphate guanylyltransferase n=1 Tax=Neogemmobacter tilapiae TaxID=875041 RepID=A0A918TJL3_9RHOB|nr:mannose-1-phosphate guanylyltransferase/mannose-6-phosphate isomerase [Gemmobacter tilapiae]GHC50632.1 mannose-1-phosphate guanylyltransferase/mannose-6-phosphate isomerase [Gemmobacter tilapiae]
MSHAKVRPVILCGGSGKRLWPVSRKSRPKQFVRLFGQESLLQTTLRRLEEMGCVNPLLMTAEDYRFVVQEQLAEMGLGGASVVVEPTPRNTGPAICAAAGLAFADDPEALLLVAPSDHHIGDVTAFGQALAAGIEQALDGRIVTFGIRPDRAETGYGYIETAERPQDGIAQTFQRFVEKPDLAGAQLMQESGRYLWNAGIFLFSARSILAAFGTHAPGVALAVKASIASSRPDLSFLRLGPEFAEAPEISVDYAVLEHVAGVVIPVSARWNDMGSWRSVWQESVRDGQEVARSGEVTAIGCADSLLRSDEPGVHLVGIGLKNIAAVATRDGVLITDLDATQSVSEAVIHLQKAGVKQADDFPRQARPWGHYETLAMGPRFQVKSIVVKPGGQLSLQSHVHRAEHWVVVEGTAQVTVGQEARLVGENQSVYIPLGAVHRLANPGKLPLRLIEVQTGAYLGEDDIRRYEDVYARK